MKTIEQIQTQINELQKELENLKNPPNYKRWRAEEDGEYYVVLSYGKISKDYEHLNNVDNGRYSSGNYFKTKEEAEKARDRQLAIVRVNDRINELNEGWEHNNNGKRFYIYYDNTYMIRYLDSIGFIIPYIINFCKTEEIAKQIIKEMEDDLNLIFNIK